MPAPIQLVCFDLGGVLIRLCDSLDHACQRAGVSPAKSINDAESKELVELAQHEEIGALEDGAFFTRAAPLLGLSPDDARAMSDAWLCGPFPGIDTLIDTLNAAGHTTACLSNTNDNHWRAMTSPGHKNHLPLEKLHHRFASHLVKDRKPNPSIYQHVEQATGNPGNSILFFDDSLDNIRAAEAQGWQTCQVTEADDPVAQMTAHLKRLNLI